MAPAGSARRRRVPYVRARDVPPPPDAHASERLRDTPGRAWAPLPNSLDVHRALVPPRWPRVSEFGRRRAGPPLAAHLRVDVRPRVAREQRADLGDGRPPGPQPSMDTMASCGLIPARSAGPPSTVFTTQLRVRDRCAARRRCPPPLAHERLGVVAGQLPELELQRLGDRAVAAQRARLARRHRGQPAVAAGVVEHRRLARLQRVALALLQVEVLHARVRRAAEVEPGRLEVVLLAHVALFSSFWNPIADAGGRPGRERRRGGRGQAGERRAAGREADSRGRAIGVGGARGVMRAAAGAAARPGARAGTRDDGGVRLRREHRAVTCDERRHPAPPTVSAMTYPRTA